MTADTINAPEWLDAIAVFIGYCFLTLTFGAATLFVLITLVNAEVKRYEAKTKAKRAATRPVAPPRPAIVGDDPEDEPQWTTTLPPVSLDRYRMAKRAREFGGTAA